MFILQKCSLSLCNIHLASEILPVGVIADCTSYLTVRSNSENRSSSRCSFKAVKATEVSGDIFAKIVHMLRCVIAVILTWDIPAASGCWCADCWMI